MAVVCRLNQDGSYAPSPWLGGPSDTPDSCRPAVAASAAAAPTTAAAPITAPAPTTAAATVPPAKSQQRPRQQQVEQTLPADEADSAAQRSAMQASSSAHDLSLPDQAGQTPPVRAHAGGLCGAALHQSLVVAAIRLVSQSQAAETRFHAMDWLKALVPHLADQACRDLANSAAVQASVQLIQRDQDDAQTHLAALAFCLGLHRRGVLPVALLVDAGLPSRLAALVIQSGQPVSKPAQGLASLWYKLLLIFRL